MIFLGDFSFVKIFLVNYRVSMLTTLNTSCSENTMVLSARRVFLHACIFYSKLIALHARTLGGNVHSCTKLFNMLNIWLV